jgi:hypothetical protein
MSEPWLEKPYDMNDYRKEMDDQKEQETIKNMKEDMLKMIDKLDELDQKITNLHFLFKDRLGKIVDGVYFCKE